MRKVKKTFEGGCPGIVDFGNAHLWLHCGRFTAATRSAGECMVIMEGVKK